MEVIVHLPKDPHTRRELEKRMAIHKFFRTPFLKGTAKRPSDFLTETARPGVFAHSAPVSLHREKAFNNIGSYFGSDVRYLDNTYMPSPKSH